MENYDQAKKFNGMYCAPNIRFRIYHLSYLSNAALLLEKEPSNMQALSLAQLIEKAVARGSWSSLCTQQ
jgi:hypothetical protein